MKAQWIAKSLVPTGDGVSNKWVCAQCPGKVCSQVLGLSEEPKDKCKEIGNE